MTDEVGRIKQDIFADLDRLYHRAAETLAWGDEMTLDVAERIWDHSGEGTSLRDLLSLAEVSQAQMYCVLAEMVRLDLLRPSGGVAPLSEKDSAPAGSWLAS
jgi:hypothetical protein